MMKKVCTWFAKAFIAVVLSFCIISVFCYFYCNYPSHYTTPSHSTDYYWDKNAITIRGTEGFALSKTDAKGYVNTYPEKNDEIDILLMGSSHTEGFNVASDKNYAYVLNKLMNDNDAGMYAYNIGVSGHTLSRCFNNLEYAINEFNPTKYISIETTSLEIPLDDLIKLDNGTYDTLPSYDSGIASLMQKSDFLRQMYSQLSNVLEQGNTDTNTVVDDMEKQPEGYTSNEDNSEYQGYLESTLKKASSVAESNGCELIITYIPPLEFNYEGDIEKTQLSEYEKIFKNLCEKYNITVIDMRSAFTDLYNETYNLPQGFSNTVVGEGHINEYGHAEIAKELYEYITEDKK